jgi:putative transposase
VCIDDLQVGSMSKSSSRIGVVPDEKVAQKSGLKAILDQGWLECRCQLE